MWRDFNSTFQYSFTVCWLSSRNHNNNDHPDAIYSQRRMITFWPTNSDLTAPRVEMFKTSILVFFPLPCVGKKWPHMVLFFWQNETAKCIAQLTYRHILGYTSKLILLALSLYDHMRCIARFGTICTIFKKWKITIEECHFK